MKLPVILFLFTGLVGCASNPKTPDYVAEEYKSEAFKIQRVALATNLSPPEIEDIDLGFTRVQGAAAGAAGGFAGGAVLGAATGFSLSPAPAECGPLAGVCVGGAVLLTGVLTVGGAVGGAVVGTVVGATKGEPAERLAEAEANAKTMLNSTNLQEALLEAAKRYGSDNTDLDFIRVPSAGMDGQTSKTAYKALLNESINVVQEIELLRVKIDEGKLEMQAEARLISVQTGALLRKGYYSFASWKRTPKEWMVDDASPLKGAIERGLTSIAEDVIDNSFPLYLVNRPRKQNVIATNAWRDAGIYALKADINRYCRKAESGDPDAQAYIGDVYYLGAYGIEKNLTLAYVWYSLSAQNSSSYSWYSLSAQNGSSYSERQVDKLTKTLTSSQLTDAKQRLGQWETGECEKELTYAIPKKGE